MRETIKTASFAAIALGLLAMAIWSGQAGRGSSSAFDDQGEPFFPEFTRAEQARGLEVLKFDPATGRAEPFEVALVDGRWVIPSHHNYPADAKDRLARTAAGILDLRKDTIRSDRLADHKAFGVIDPREAKLADSEGVGERVTLRDETGAVLADLILGKSVPSAEGQRFVRVPGHNRVYGVRLDGVELSTRFGDWIEPGLLDLRPEQIRAVRIDNYKIDTKRNTIQPVAQIRVERPDATSPWRLDRAEPAPSPGRQLDNQAMASLTNTLGNLRIVGVRPKPDGLRDNLMAVQEQGSLRISQPVLRSLVSRGFHLVRGQLLSNEGEVDVETADGVAYQLRFGEVTFARGEALTAGEGDEAVGPQNASNPDEAGTPEDAVESRYLFVTAQFVPDLIPNPSEPGELPEPVFAYTAEERARHQSPERRAAQAAYDQAVQAGKARAKALSERFAGWYYVVPGDAFRKIVLDVDGLTRSAAPEPGGPRGSLPPGLQGLPSFPGSPPGR